MTSTGPTLRPYVTVLALILGLGSAGGCDDAPHEAVDAFLVAAHDGDKDAACAAFSRPSRALMRDMAAVGYTGGRDPCDYLFEVFTPRGVYSLETTAKEGDDEGNKAEVTIVDLDGERSSVTLVKEEGRWKIDVRNALPSSR